MTSRSARFIGLSAVGALAVGTLVAPQAMASNDDPVFVSVGATALGVAADATARVSAPSQRASATVAARSSTVKLSSTEQALQVVGGLSGTATARVPTAWLGVGSEQVLQMSPVGARLLTKSTGKQIGSGTSLKTIFGVDEPNVVVTDPTVAYDVLDQRWVIVAIATNDQGTVGLSDDVAGFVVRVSKGATLNEKPNKWNAPFGYADTDDVTESAPRIGVSGDKIVITSKAVDASDASRANCILVLPKQKLYAATVTGPDAWVSTVNDTYDGQTPTVNASGGNPAFTAVPDTSDFTVYTLTGAATNTAPAFSKSVMYPTISLVDAPDVPQSGGDAVDLPRAIDSASVSWRNGVMWAALTVGCDPSDPEASVPVATNACIRVLKVTTNSGISLALEQTRSKSGKDWFAPGIAIDGGNLPHLGFSWSDPASAPAAVSTAVTARKSDGSWAVTVLKRGTQPFTNGLPGATAPWAVSGAASVDPTSPWDVWVSSGLTSDLVAPPNWTTSIDRVSLATNVATVKASKKKVKKGAKVTFTSSLKRPQSSDAVKGLPIALQAKPKGSSKWKTLASGKTSSKGVAKWTVKVKKTTDYRTYGKAVQQSGGQGRLVTKVYGKAVRVTAT